MKAFYVLALFIFTSGIVSAQGNGKAKGKNKNNGVVETPAAINQYNQDQQIWEGTFDDDGGGPKPSKNQPKKVKEAFFHDYPYAGHVSWSRYRGDWTATFTHGPVLSTAVYHANGDRRDTRTSIVRAELPAVVVNNIFLKRPGVELGVIVKIEVPGIIGAIFRVKTILGGNASFVYYNDRGAETSYDY